MLVASSSQMTPPRDRAWIVATNDGLLSLLWSTDNVCLDSYLTISCVVTTVALAGALEQVSAITLSKTLRSSSFSPSVVRSPPPLRLGLRTNETGVRRMAQSVNIKCCFTRTGVNTVVNSKLHEWQMFAPFLGSFYCAQYILRNKIGPFGLAIGLGRIGGSHLELATKQVKHMAPKP